jgi:protein TonB
MHGNLAAQQKQPEITAGGTDASHASGIRLSRRQRPPLNWTSPSPRAFASRRELFAVIVLSVLVHGGVAAAAYQNRDTGTAPKRVSKVEIELTRPPQIPKPIQNTPPPPPPKEVPRQVKPAAVAPPTEVPQPIAATKPIEQPIDTGSSSPSAEDGELFAGSGGLGTAAPTPPPPPAPVAPVAPAPLIQASEGANYAKNPRPAYPGRAKREGWQGTTLLRVQVQPNGRPGAVKVQRSSGRDVLDEAALDAVKKWTFVPATQGGNPVGGYVTVPIVFRLQ